MFAHPKPTGLPFTRRTIYLRSILLSPPTPSARTATRFLSTRSDPPICKFINAASFIGKPVSEQELLQAANLRRQNPTGFGQWVEAQKKEWSRKVLASYPPEAPPKYESLTNSGHDWWFINQSETDSARSTYIGVADGVGGWAEGGNDPAEVSQGIMFHADQILKNQTTQQPDGNPGSLLSTAFQEMLKDDQVRGGASTALIAQLDPTSAVLHWANLGDSSMMHIKAGAEKVGMQTKPQTHFFNCPYQLTKFPAGYSAHEFVADTPQMADAGSLTLQDGDLVLLFTDGIGDNLWTEEIRTLVRLVTKSKPAWDDHDLVHSLAHTMCGAARRASFQPNRSTPFEAEAIKHGITDLKGGKVDDITLVVSLVRYTT